ncbi:MAG: DUF3450 family protein [Kiritimatiellae bacterium]|nr:DUF3450 family protein [Kiritimatiellia bacterium]
MSLQKFTSFLRCRVTFLRSAQLCLLVLFGLSWCQPALCGDTPDGELGQLEALVGQWTKLQLSISEEERSWASKEAQWNSEIDLLKREKEKLELAAAEDTAILDDQSSQGIQRIVERDRLRASIDALGPILERAESDLRPWPDRLPPLLRAPFIEIIRNIPTTASQRDSRSKVQRLQTVFSAYEEIERLQNAIHVGVEMVAMQDGSRREMDVCYIGLARGFAVSADQSFAAVADVSDTGWHWEAAPQWAPSIRRAIDVIHGRHSAEWVTLPFQVKGTEE